MSAPGSHRRGWIGALVGASLALTMTPGIVSAATPWVRFGADYNGCSVYGVGPRSTLIKVTWKDSNGSLKHVQVVKSKTNGAFQTTCDYDEQVERGDVFTAKVGTRTRSFTVPALKIGIDRVTDVVSGRGPANTTLTIGLPDSDTMEVLTTGDGSYDQDVTSVHDIIGYDLVSVSYATGDGDVVYRALRAPFVMVYRDRADVRMGGRPGRLMTVELYDPTVLKSDVDCAVGPTGGCWLQFTDEDGHMVRTRAGDRVTAPSIASDLDFIVPAVTTKGVPSTDVLSGTCLAGQSSPYYVEAYRPSGGASVSRSGVTSAMGTYRKDVTSSYDLRSGDKLFSECMLPSGDWVAKLITVP